MTKVIPISAVLLLSMGSVYAQYGSVTSPTTPTNTPGTTLPSTNTLPATPGQPNTTGASTGVTPTTVTTPATGITTTTPSATSTTTGTTGVTTTTIPGATTTPTTPALIAPTTFTCTGNNPTWNLSVSKDLITYSSAKDATVKIKSVIPMVPAGDTTGNVQTYQARANDGKPVTILIRKNTAGCTNGLPGTSYQYDVFVIFPNMVVVGCCNPV